MDDPAPRADRVARSLDRHHPRGRTVLELGCGTGAVLARLPDHLTVTGLDRSPEMLAAAAVAVPGVRLVEADMAAFELGDRFDAVVCVFDSLNHLCDPADWARTFERVHAHLADDGVFVLDVNTVGELRRLGEEPPWVEDFDGGVFVLDVTAAEDGSGVTTSVWDLRVFEHLDGDAYRLHHERIGEIALPLDRLCGLLGGWFELLEVSDQVGDEATDGSVTAHLVGRRRP
jgi:SAM-dependent methyltransferase